MSANYDAMLVGGSVYVIAIGENPTSNWKNYFQKSLIAVYPPAYTFVQEPPVGPALMIITPFSRMTSFLFDANVNPTTVNVSDDLGVHVIPIRTIVSHAERALLDTAVVSRMLLPGNPRLMAVAAMLAAPKMELYYERSLGSYDDHLSQHCSTECVRVEEIDHTGIKVCTEYRTVCQHIRVHAVLVVEVGTAQDVASAVEAALQTAAIAGAIAAFIAAFATGGTGAAGAAKATFVSVLASELSRNLQNLIRVDVDYRNEWV